LVREAPPKRTLSIASASNESNESDTQIEIADPRKLQEGLRRREHDLLHDGADLRIELLAPAMCLHMPADDIVQREGRRKVLGTDTKPLGELLSNHLAKRPPVGGNEQAGAHDRDDSPLVYKCEQLLPELIELSRRIPLRSPALIRHSCGLS
jgi:hypothetical protein